MRGLSCIVVVCMALAQFLAVIAFVGVVCVGRRSGVRLAIQPPQRPQVFPAGKTCGPKVRAGQQPAPNARRLAHEFINPKIEGHSLAHFGTDQVMFAVGGEELVETVTAVQIVFAGAAVQIIVSR